MGVVFDEVVADISTPEPVRTEAAEAGESEENRQLKQIKRKVLQAIERNKYRAQRLRAD